MYQLIYILFFTNELIVQRNMRPVQRRNIHREVLSAVISAALQFSEKQQSPIAPILLISPFAFRPRPFLARARSQQNSSLPHGALGRMLRQGCGLEIADDRIRRPSGTRAEHPALQNPPTDCSSHDVRHQSSAKENSLSERQEYEESPSSASS